MEFFEIHIATSRNQMKDQQSKTGKQSESRAAPPIGGEGRIPNNEKSVPALLRHLSIRPSFVIRHSCFVIAFSSPTCRSEHRLAVCAPRGFPNPLPNLQASLGNRDVA
jgi:hypothetical protein